MGSINNLRSLSLKTRYHASGGLIQQQTKLEKPRLEEHEADRHQKSLILSRYNQYYKNALLEVVCGKGEVQKGKNAAMRE